MEALGFNLTSFIFQVVNFLVLMAVLTHFLHKPLLNLLDSRKRELEESARQAAAVKTALAEAEARQQAILQEAQTSAQALLTKAREQAKSLEEKLRGEAAARAEELLAQAISDTELERERLRSELRQELASFVVLTTEKVIQHELPAKLKHDSLQRDLEGLTL